MIKRIWGLEFEEIMSDSYKLWRVWVRKPFKKEGCWQIGLNEKFLNTASSQGVDNLLLILGERETYFKVPNEKDLKTKDKQGEFELMPSIFKDGLPMKIYHFKLNL